MFLSFSAFKFHIEQDFHSSSYSVHYRFLGIQAFIWSLVACQTTTEIQKWKREEMCIYCPLFYHSLLIPSPGTKPVVSGSLLDSWSAGKLTQQVCIVFD